MSDTSEEKLLKLRALRLVNRSQHEALNLEEESVLIFVLGQERFAIRMTEISEVVPMTKLTIVPGSSSKIMGVMPIKGEVHCIFDLNAVMGFSGAHYDPSAKASSHILVMRLSGHRIGFGVDQIVAIDQIPLKSESETASTQRRMVKPRQNAPLILIEEFEKLLGTLLQGEKAS